MVRKFGAALAAGAVAVAMTACSGDTEETAQAAAPSSSASESAEGVFDRIKSLVDDTQEVESYRARVTGSSEGEDLEMEIAYMASPEPTVEMVMGTPEGELTILVRGSEMLMGNDTDGWLRMDAGEDAFQQQEGMQDPFEELDKLLASEDVQEEGTEEVDGVPTTRYAGSYSVDDALEGLDPQAGEEARRLYEEAGITEVPFTLWVREDGLPHRFEFVDSDATEVRMDFLEFNSEVAIEFPAEDQIMDMSALGEELGSMGG
ncbi:LppX_LprAFG lipoprotein [Thermobifida halotolerans]|uniref:LppX_LprAFG lipoprotein n=1 Tax=Thermobifida halotolerans TaxID=483545 RepID=A0A399FVX5_9ACTN|nr:LppX_LprAFG lipoprotein [Thermobifida halotolerans]UOE18375.1 LppX_LprAFG lipoprotein [Thermobifida halotolerans]